jgi:hypothetical protein
MTAIEVARLRIRWTAEQRDRTRFAIEDGLRTAIPDDRRLVLLRKMQVGSQAGSRAPAQVQAAVRDGWLAAISGARHGGDDGAADSNCVWFASHEEAEILLLSRLLAGRAVDAWFWKLAVPDWGGAPLQMWVSNALSEAIRHSQDRRILALVQCFITAGAVDRLIETITGGTDAPVAALRESFRQQPVFDLFGEREPADEVERMARNFVGSMPPGLRQMIVLIARANQRAGKIARAIVRAWVLKQSPALALSPSLLTDILEAAVDAIAAPATPAPARRLAAQPVVPMPVGSARLEMESAPPSTKGKAATTVDRGRYRTAKVVADENPRIEPTFERQIAEINRAVPHRLYSPHAGLWLVVPSLAVLGFPEWLEQRPALLGDNPGGQLLHEIARYHSIAPDDPVLAIVSEFPRRHPPSEWPRMWRHGLDRWLRRTVRRRLHDLVNRPGELDCGESSLTVHYPAADADLALRRQALDRDPGWTEWLGLAVRYNFGGKEDWV